MNYNHEANGKFGRSKRLLARIVFWVKVWLWRSAIVCAFGWAFYAGHAWNAFEAAHTVYAGSMEVVTRDLSPEKITALQNEALGFLASCEGKGAPLIQYDNKADGSLKGKDIPSLGDYRFKIGTVEHYEKVLNGKSLSEREAITEALDSTAARELARQIIFNSKADWTSDWVNCSQKVYSFHGEKMTLETIVTAIKAISK